MSGGAPRGVDFGAPGRGCKFLETEVTEKTMANMFVKWPSRPLSAISWPSAQKVLFSGILFDRSFDRFRPSPGTPWPCEARRLPATPAPGGSRWPWVGVHGKTAKRGNRPWRRLATARGWGYTDKRRNGVIARGGGWPPPVGGGTRINGATDNRPWRRLATGNGRQTKITRNWLPPVGGGTRLNGVTRGSRAGRLATGRGWGYMGNGRQTKIMRNCSGNGRQTKIMRNCSGNGRQTKIMRNWLPPVGGDTRGTTARLACLSACLTAYLPGRRRETSGDSRETP